MANSLVAQMVKNLSAMQETLFDPWVDSLEKGKLPNPVFLPGEFHGQRSLVGYSPWSCIKSDRTDRLRLTLLLFFFFQVKYIIAINFIFLTFLKCGYRKKKIFFFEILNLHMWVGFVAQ